MAGDSTFTAGQIAEALVETIAEKEREPSTSIWAAFWDRLTEGGTVPAWIDPAAELRRLAERRESRP